MARPNLRRPEIFTLDPDLAGAHRRASVLFEEIAARLRAILPVSADIRHIGATAIPGCLTKGDLDIVVRVHSRDFERADAALAGAFARNAGSDRTDDFSAFEDNGASPSLGVQLTALSGPCDDFHRFVDVLGREPGLVAEYNALKTRFNGKPMDDYRNAKAEFIARVLASDADARRQE